MYGAETRLSCIVAGRQHTLHASPASLPARMDPAFSCAVSIADGFMHAVQSGKGSGASAPLQNFIGDAHIYDGPIELQVGFRAPGGLQVSRRTSRCALIKLILHL
jgi:hypothetical protein